MRKPTRPLAQRIDERQPVPFAGAASGRGSGGTEAGKASVPARASAVGEGNAGEPDAAGGHLRPVRGMRKGTGASLRQTGAAALLHRGVGRRCGGLFAALLPPAHAVGQGWQSAGLLCVGGRSAH